MGGGLVVLELAALGLNFDKVFLSYRPESHRHRPKNDLWFRSHHCSAGPLLWISPLKIRAEFQRSTELRGCQINVTFAGYFGAINHNLPLDLGNARSVR